jgi:dolichol-phosphate mannosyltransferase
MLKTLVIIPCYNESENIVKLIDALLVLPVSVDVLVVDDSADNTAELVRSRQANEPRLHLIKRHGKGGRGTAVLDGIDFGMAHGYERIAEMDADFSHDPREFPKLLAVSGDNVMVIGSRDLKESKIVGWPWKRTYFHYLANFYANLILRIGIKDYTNGYRIYGRGALQKLDRSKIKGIGYIVLSEISYQLFRRGVKFIEVPTVFVNRARGASNFSMKEIKEAFTSVIRVRLNYGK